MRQEAVADPVKLLRQEGTTNQEIEKLLEDSSREFPRTITRQEECRLDQIIQEPLDHGEEVYLLNQDYFITSTGAGSGYPGRGWEDGRKGHEIRNMAVWREHGVLPDPGETCQGYSMGDTLREITARQIGEGEMVIYGSMESISEHFHFVASDLENKGESDLTDVNSYFRYHVEDGRPEMVEHNIRDSFGRYLGELLL